jgi:Xaa-Pro aminopeptidase
MNKDIVDRVAAAAGAEGLDAVVALSPENFAYLAGFVVPSHPLLRWRHAGACVTADGRSALLSVDMEASTVRSWEPEAEVRVWQEFEDNAMAVLSELLGDLGLAAGRIGVETDYLPARDLERLRERLPEARWEAAQGILNRLRMTKSPREVDLMRRLARLTDRAIRDGYAAVHPGDTEMDLAGAVVANLYRLGAESFRLLIVASGERSQ